MRALKPQRRRNRLTGQWINLEPVEKLRCDACSAWEGPKTPILPVTGQLPNNKSLDLCPHCTYRARNLKPIAR